MVFGPDFFQSPKPEHYAEITGLLDAAFGGTAESRLVDELRADGDMWHEAMLTWDGEIVAYAALSRMRNPSSWASLAPLAVLPRYQGHNWHLGTRMAHYFSELVHYADRWAQNGGPDYPDTIVVLGEVSFYERARFSLARAQKLTSPYPLSHTMIARAGNDMPVETLEYPLAFERLGD